jgi:hypothetical protein
VKKGLQTFNMIVCEEVGALRRLEPYGVGVWKCIRREWDDFANHVRYEVEDGSKVLFVHDVWGASFEDLIC